MEFMDFKVHITTLKNKMNVINETNDMVSLNLTSLIKSPVLCNTKF